MTILAKRSTPLFIGFILSIAAVGLGFVVGVDHIDGAKLAARWTSRVGVPVFLAAYLASSLFRISKSPMTKALVQRRRQWGLAFAWTHSVHLVVLTYYLAITYGPPDIITLLGGGLAYAMIYIMAITSNDRSVKSLGKNWKRIHIFGIHYIWLIYTFTYAGRLVDPELRHIGVIAMIIFFSALAIRLYARWSK